MRILVLSHARSGSTILCKWLSKELNIELDETPYDYKTFNSIFNKNSLIRKILLRNMIHQMKLLKNLIKLFV